VKRAPNFRSIALVAAATCLGACSMFSSHPDYYTKSAEARPLEVPPDLDSPPNANELTVPAGSGASSGAPAESRPGLAANQLLVTDDVKGTWTKVGPAIERAKIGALSMRDDNAHSYILDFDAPIPKPTAEHHWYTAVFNHLGFGEGDPVKAHLLVVVSEDGAGSRINVAGSGGDKSTTAASLRVIQVLHDAIPGSSFPPASTPPPAVAVAVPAPSSVASTAPPAAAPPAPVAASAPPAAAVSSTPPPISGVSTGGTDLHVADTVPNVWTRVGLALERAQLGTLSGRDQNAHTYTLDFSGTVETKSEGEHHWYTRVLHPFGGDTKKEQVTRKLTVRVAEDAGGARVSVEGDGTDKETTDAARHVAQVLRDRLS